MEIANTMNGGQSIPQQKSEHAKKSTERQDRTAADTEHDQFPQTFQLYGKTCEGDDFLQGATVTRKKPRSDVVIGNVDTGGILHHTGIREGDVLVEVNGADVQWLDLDDLVVAIGKLDAFHYVLLRKTLHGRKKCRYIQVGFQTGYKSGSEQVDIKILSAHFGVSRDEELYFPIAFDRLALYRRLLQRTVRVRVDVDGDSFRFMNTDPADNFVEFTRRRANFTQYLYVNLENPNDVATVLCPTRTRCIKANSTNDLFVGAVGRLESSYTELDERFLMLEPTNSQLAKLESYYNSGYSVTVDTSDYRGIMAETGVQEFRIIEQ